MRNKLLAMAISTSILTGIVPLSANAIDGADTSWYNESSISFTITTAEQLAGLSDLSWEGNDFSGKTIILGSDISLDGIEWQPIGELANQFSGVFDGNGYEISDLKSELKSEQLAGGLFDVIGENGVVKNLTVSGESLIVNSYSTSSCGGIARLNDGIIANVHSDVDITYSVNRSSPYLGGMGDFGGIVGFNRGTILNSYYSGDIIVTHPAYVGGVVGRLGGAAINVYNSGTVTYQLGGSKTGGVSGTEAASNTTIIDAYYLEGSLVTDEELIVEGTVSFTEDNGGTLSTPVNGNTTLIQALNAGVQRHNSTNPSITASAWIVGEDGLPALQFNSESTVTQPEPAQPILPSSAVLALSTPSKVLVDGVDTAFDAYNIDGNNYFKLRDLANVVSGTEKQFEVTWDAEMNAINLISGEMYTEVGGEMSAASGVTKEGTLSTSAVYVDGEETEFTAYNIDGNNYFKLRDVAKVFDIGVTWDGETSTIGIDTTISYVE